jgi:cysteine desulfurase family protein
MYHLNETTLSEQLTGMNINYFDNAATSWPKPAATIAAMQRFNECIGGSPGRSGHRLSIDAGRTVLEARELVSTLLGVENILRIVFTKNATEALNIGVFGLLNPGDHVITSSMEHNSVMRPLRAMADQGIDVSVVPCSPEGVLDPQDVEHTIRGTTKAIYLTHASNVTGTIMPLAEIGRIAHDHGVIFCVDAAQTAGIIPIDVEGMYIDLLAFTGHKSLFGPQGTGGLYVGQGLEKELLPIMRGGTGSLSESENHPDFLPDRYESGTLNAIGLAGLAAGIRFVLQEGIENIRTRERMLMGALVEGLESIDGVRVFGCRDAHQQTAVVSFVMPCMSPSDIALALDEEFHIMARPGLQCAPAAHKTIGTFPEGTLRLSPGYFTTEDQVQHVITAISQIAHR